MPKRLCYLPEIYSNRPGSQTIHAFNRSLRKAGVAAVRHHSNAYITNIARYCDDKGWGRNFIRLSGRAYLVAMMWPKGFLLVMALIIMKTIGIYREFITLNYNHWGIL